jgi:hypothetical protein
MADEMDLRLRWLMRKKGRLESGGGVKMKVSRRIDSKSCMGCVAKVVFVSVVF